MNERVLREHLKKLLDGHDAHVEWRATFAGLPAKHRGAKPPGAPYSAWELLEHMRIAQRDILEFCRNPKHVSPDWPSGYWPKKTAPPSPAAWGESLEAFERDLKEMQQLIEDPETDLFARIPHGSGQSVLREVLLVADHNAYHLGQVVLLRRLCGAWPKS